MEALFWFLAGVAYVFIGMMALNSCRARLYEPIDKWIGRSLWRGMLVITAWVVAIPLTRLSLSLR